MPLNPPDFKRIITTYIFETSLFVYLSLCISYVFGLGGAMFLRFLSMLHFLIFCLFSRYCLLILMENNLNSKIIQVNM